MNRLSFSRQLMVGASVVALLAAIPAADARAQSAPRPGWHASFEGRYGWNEGSRVPTYAFANDIPYEPSRSRADEGFAGRLGLVYGLGKGWDVALGVTAAFLDGKRQGNSGFQLMGPRFWTEQGETKLDYGVVDFEAGYHAQMGDSAVRVFGGLRAALFKQRTRAHVTGDFPGPGFYVNDGKRKTDFWGIGPRIGLDAQFGLGPRTHLFAQAAGAGLLGRYQDRTKFCFVYFPVTSACYRYKDKDKTKFALNAELALGVGYRFDTGGAPLTLQAGYRGEAWWGIGSRADVIGYPNAPLGGGYYRHRDGDYLLHGPFVRVTVGLGGP